MAAQGVERKLTSFSVPIKRMFLCDSEFITANVAIIKDSGNALHTHRAHDEIVVILRGEVDFRAEDETRRMPPGDLIFIPKTASAMATDCAPSSSVSEHEGELEIVVHFFKPGGAIQG